MNNENNQKQNKYPDLNKLNLPVYKDEKGNDYWLVGPTNAEVSKKIRKQFWGALITLAILIVFFSYIIGTGRIPFVGNLTDEIYKYKVQRYYDANGIDQKVDPNLTYDEEHPGKLIENPVEGGETE